MKGKSLFELHKLLFKKKISCLDLSKIFIKEIQNNFKLKSFTDINESIIISQAIKADLLLKNSNGKFLTGIPIAIKDIFVDKKFFTSAGSKMLKNYISPYNSTLFRRLRNLGMVVIGKTNMNEFSVGSNSLNLEYGNVNNTFSNLITPGGSSGGSAVSVSFGLSPISIGGDTGGSIRLPSCFTNTLGLKPTYGRLSRYGMISYSSSLDQPGIISKNILDLAILFNGISGLDIRDNTTLNFKPEDFTRYLNKNWLLNNRTNKIFLGLKVGISKDYFNEIYNYHIRSNIEFVLTNLEFLGASVIYLKFFFTEIISTIYNIISSSEFSSNLARFDGLKYGYNLNNFNNNFIYSENIRSFNFNDVVKNRILIGNYILSNFKGKKCFYQSKKLRKFIINDLQNKFMICDVIICPVSPVLPWYIYKKLTFREKVYIDIYTILINLSGVPSITVPSGFINKFNIKFPISFQIVGNYCKEARIIQIVYEFQKYIFNKNNFNGKF